MLITSIQKTRKELIEFLFPFKKKVGKSQIKMSDVDIRDERREEESVEEKKPTQEDHGPL